jgi:hypothetical protein
MLIYLFFDILLTKGGALYEQHLRFRFVNESIQRKINSVFV